MSKCDLARGDTNERIRREAMKQPPTLLASEEVIEHSFRVLVPRINGLGQVGADHWRFREGNNESRSQGRGVAPRSPL